MLMRIQAKKSAADRSLRRERQLWHDVYRNSPSLGCLTCPERSLCGGVCVAAPYFDCLTYCCGNAVGCTSICRANPKLFARRLWEINGFALDNVPRGPVLPAPDLPRVGSVVFHGNSRAEAAKLGVAALPLSTMFNRRDGCPRYGSPAELRDAFCLTPDTPIMLTGTEDDPPLERWWELGVSRRAAIIRAMRAAGVGLTTTPNYSLIVNAPRWDDLYAMKRIALVHAEFLAEGMPAALHVNGRTDTDFRRWAEFIAVREEITHVAYEFTTGTGRARRRNQHAIWLAGLAADVGRPLHLIMRGGFDLLGTLVTRFSGITVLETDSFMRTMKRRRAMLAENGQLSWRASPTRAGTPLDTLYAGNVEAVQTSVENLMMVEPVASIARRA
jgi:hypothetical protein